MLQKGRESMIDVSELISDPDFATNYTVLRRTGRWVSGRFVLDDEPVELRYYRNGGILPTVMNHLSET